MSRYEQKEDEETGDPVWIENEDELDRFFTYLDHWIGKKSVTRGTGRRRPTFRIELWNQYAEVQEDPTGKGGKATLTPRQISQIQFLYANNCERLPYLT